jgi:hypothetical protein
MGAVAFYAKGLIGGGVNDLDTIISIDPGGGVQYCKDGDIATVMVSGVKYDYQYDGSNNNATNPESSPGVIVPDDNVTGTGAWILQGSVRQDFQNIKPVVNAAVNKLDIFTKSGGAVPDAANVISVAIPDGNGYTFRSRAAAYLSGTSQFILADATDYWSKGDLAAEIKTAWLYAIWDGTGIVWALAGYSGFNMVPITTTVGDDDYFLLEAGSTYTRNNAHHCVCVGKIRYEYDTGDAPDHTIQATVENAPQVIWNPKSDYGYSKSLASSNAGGAADIVDYSMVSLVVKQSGMYSIKGQFLFADNLVSATGDLYIKTGSATYASAIVKSRASPGSVSGYPLTTSIQAEVLLNAGDTIHLGGAVTAASGNRTIYGDNSYSKCTMMSFCKID